MTMQSFNDHSALAVAPDKIGLGGKICLTTASGQSIRAASAIASAEDSLRAARELAYRVEHIIDRLCGSAGIGAGEVGETEKPPVLVRLRQASQDTDSAISRAHAALDRLDVELN
jgi:signal transduction protein with GAF and PtsI domain